MALEKTSKGGIRFMYLSLMMEIVLSSFSRVSLKVVQIRRRVSLGTVLLVTI
jgi:hypothetical protein